MVVPIILKVLTILSLVITTGLAYDNCVKNEEGDYPIIDITTYIEGICRHNTSEAKESLRILLKEELSPTLFFATDYNRNILRTLNETFVKVANWIAEADSSNSLNLRRQIVLALRPIKDLDLSVSNDYHLLPKEVLKTIRDTLVRIVIDWGFPTECEIEHSDQFITEVSNDIAALRKWKQVEVGVGYPWDGWDCFFGTTIVEAKFVVLTMNLMAEVGLPESYTIFKEHIDDYLDQSVSHLNTTLLRMNLYPHTNAGYNEQFRSYQNLAYEYAAKWQEESKCRIILTMINEYKPSAMLPSTRQLREELTAWNYTSPRIIPYFFVDQLSKLDMDDCLLTRLGQVATRFDTMVMDLDVWRSIVVNTENSIFPNTDPNDLYCRNRDDKYFILPAPTNILVIVNLTKCWKESCNSVEQVLERLVDNTTIRGMTVKSVIFDFINENDNVTADMLKFSPSLLKDYTLGCYSKFGSLESAQNDVQIANLTCPILPSETGSVSVWEFSIIYDFLNFYEYTTKTQPGLYNVFEKVSNLRKVEPWKEVIIRLVVRPDDTNWNTQTHLFCDETTSGAHLLLEAVATWARIHDIRVILKPAFDTPEYVGWWSKVWARAALYVARNYPPNSNFGWDPCIPWIEDANEEISFDDSVSSSLGISVDMGIRTYSPGKKPINLGELEMMVLFGLHVSPTMQILTRANDLEDVESDINIITEMISDLKFADTLRLNNISNATFYINIPLISSTTSLQSLFKATEGSMFKVEGVHTPISVYSSQKEPKEFESFIINIVQWAQFGVSLKGCHHHSIGLANWPAVELVLNASYLVCEHSRILDKPPTQEKEFVHEFLDSHFANKKFISSRFPNLQRIIFEESFRRVHIVEHASVVAPRYMKYMSLLNDFRKRYNISLFIFGLDHDDSQFEFRNSIKQTNQFELGWWTISDYSDLSVTSVYSEKQSKYFNKTTWRPLLKKDNVPETTKETSFPPWLIAIISVTSIVVVLGSLLEAIYIATLRRRVQLLTDKEVVEFFEGAQPDEQGFLCQRYSERFEIPKAELNPGDRRILGTGNFGLVYEAEVKGSRVAVKVPHDNCSKETFRSMLFEVKILAYLGTHENVIEFVGCYTKEIQDGVIFIATKLCERGSLLNYLIRDLRIQDESAQEIRLQELVRFSLQIACGMEYISGKRIVHGDLSTRNVLLDADMTCKIADFGLSRKVYEYGKYVKENQEPLPWRWMAYESLVDMEFTSQSDVWSYGVTLWEIFSLGATPYSGLSWTVEFAPDLKKGLRLGSPEYATEAMYEYLKMRTCWKLDAATRPDFKELLQFFQGIRNEQFYSEI